jgi:Tol biopolymer transport system component
LIHSDAREFAPRWSPDGQKIASISTQTGNQEIWVSDADGSHRAPITHMKAFQLWWPRWSPDGRTISFVERANGELNVNRVPSDGRGEPARIPLPQGTHQATWSHDGQSTYFSLMSVMKARADGQQQKKLTDNWGDHEPDESVDGKYVYFRRDRSIWRVHTTGEAAAEEEVIVPDHDARVPAFQTAAAGLYYLERDRDERTVAIRFYDFQTKKSRELVRLPVADPSAVSDFSVSPDGRTVLYSTVDRSQTTLVLTENFR